MGDTDITASQWELVEVGCVVLIQDGPKDEKLDRARSLLCGRLRHNRVVGFSDEEVAEKE
jgi:hypothetical protein